MTVAERIKVYDIAKAEGDISSAIIAKLADAGITVKSHLSWVDMEDAIRVFGWGEDVEKTPANEDIPEDKKLDKKLVNLVALRDSYPSVNKIFYKFSANDHWTPCGSTKNKDEVWAMWASYKDGKMILPDGHHELECYAVVLGEFSPRTDCHSLHLADTFMDRDSHPSGVLAL